jgi:uncharacterized protein (DUF1697 family)
MNCKMAALRLAFEAAGFTDVKTVLASGNVLFETDAAAGPVKDALESALRERFGYEAWVHVLTVAQIVRIVAAYPYERTPERHAYVVFILKGEVRDELLAVQLDPEVEQAQAGDGVIYWSVPKGSTLDSAMGKAQGSGRHKPWLTTRNLNTLEKLAR